MGLYIMTKLSKPKVERHNRFAYTIKSDSIPEPADANVERRGIIKELKGEVIVTPFKIHEGVRAKPRDVRKVPNGKLALSARRKRLALRISIDRDVASEQAFRDAFEKLITNYVSDVIKIEVEECIPQTDVS